MHAGGLEARKAVAKPQLPRPAKKTGPMLQVLNGLSASSLPSAAVAMLEGMLDDSLGIYAEKRDDFQGRVVDMIGGVLSAVEESYEKRVAEAEGIILEENEAREKLEIKIAATLDELRAKQDAVLMQKRELAEVSRCFFRSRTAAAEAEANGHIAEMEASNKIQEKESLALLLEDFLKPVEEGKAEELLDRLKVVGLNPTQVVALPAVITKPASARGSFDTMVIMSVRDDLEARIAAIDMAVQNADSIKVANAEAIHEAQAAFEQLKVQQMAQAEAYWKVRGEEEQLEEQLADLGKASRERKQALKSHNSALAKASRLLSNFQKGPKSAFEGLRNAAEPTPESAAEVEPRAELAAEVEPAAEEPDMMEGAAPDR